MLLEFSDLRVKSSTAALVQYSHHGKGCNSKDRVVNTSNKLASGAFNKFF